MQFFNSSGIKIAFSVHGNGEPILLIHGFASNSRVNWLDTGWIDFLVNSGRQVIAMDNRGHGESEKLYDSSLYGSHLMAEDAVNLIRHLGLKKTNIMGYSMGARICAFIAINNSNLINKIIFSGLAENMIKGIGGEEKIAEALIADNPATITNPKTRSYRLFADSTKSDRNALAACILSSRIKITAEQLKKVTNPVLIAVGDKDDIAGSPEPLAKVIPQAEILMIHNGNHMNSVGHKIHKEGVLSFLNQ